MQVQGGGEMQLRSSDPDHLESVHIWFGVLTNSLKSFKMTLAFVGCRCNK